MLKKIVDTRAIYPLTVAYFISVFSLYFSYSLWQTITSVVLLTLLVIWSTCKGIYKDKTNEQRKESMP